MPLITIGAVAAATIRHIKESIGSNCLAPFANMSLPRVPIATIEPVLRVDMCFMVSKNILRPSTQAPDSTIVPPDQHSWKALSTGPSPAVVHGDRQAVDLVLCCLLT